MGTQLSEQALTDLAKYDTPTVCNVIELWNVRPRNAGYMDHSIRSCFPQMPPMVGFALTSGFRSMAPPRGGDVYAAMTRQIEMFGELPGPPVVVVQDLDDRTAAATFGEVMCTTYQAFGARGLITSGTGRDLDQVEAIGFPVFTNGATCAHGYCHLLSIGSPVTVGGITVFTGELLHGDCNGVTTVPLEIAAEVPDACRELMAAEDIVLKYVRGQSVTPAGLSQARDECSSVIAGLGKRLRGEA